MKLYGLIGFPLGHSFSKKYFTEKFEKENITDSIFELFPLENIALFPGLISNHKDIIGLAVTIPYKESVIAFLDQLDEEAKQTGAVNCIKIVNNTLKGYNTDIIGFEKSLVPRLKKNHTKALVLGSGGSSKAVQYVLKKLAIPFLIVSRQETKQTHFIPYEMIDEKILESYPLIINCTPVGMSPNDRAFPVLPYTLLNKLHLLYDLIYSPASTVFLQKGLAQGAEIKNGYEMLLLQAAENWRIWNEP